MFHVVFLNGYAEMPGLFFVGSLMSSSFKVQLSQSAFNKLTFCQSESSPTDNEDLIETTSCARTYNSRRLYDQSNVLVLLEPLNILIHKMCLC